MNFHEGNVQMGRRSYPVRLDSTFCLNLHVLPYLYRPASNKLQENRQDLSPAEPGFSLF